MLGVVNPSLMKIQWKTSTNFPTSNTLKTLQTHSLNHHHRICRGRKHTPARALHSAITLLSHGNVTLRVALGQAYKTLPTTCLWGKKSTNISTVGSRRRVWRRTMTMCCSKKTQLCISQGLKMGIASSSSWLACQMIRLSWTGNYMLLRIWDGTTISHTLANTGVKTSSKAWNGWCGSQPSPSISFTPLRVALIAKRHWNTSIPKCTLWTGGGRHR